MQGHPAQERDDERGGLVLAAALEYHRRGWSIIPIAAGMKKPPKRFGWKRYQTQPATEAELRLWFDGRDDLGLAVILGGVSGGLACRDFDDRRSYRRWKRAHPDLARMLPTVETPRGRHVYLRAPPSALFFRDLRPEENGEYRGDSGHYCLLPPCHHPDGPEYRWAVPLPEGEVPFIEDLVAAGFFSAPHETQKAQGSPKESQVVGTPAAPGRAASRLPIPVQTMIEETIARTIPTGPGTRRAKLMELVRRLKFLPEFAEVPATGIDFLQPYLRRWWKEAKPRTSGKHPQFWRSWQDFVFAWEEARVPYGATMKAIFETACSTPPPKLAVEKYGQGSLRALLASLCRELQRYNGGDRFHLSGRTAAPLLGVSDTQAWRWLKQLERDEIIEPVKKYPKGVRKATEYRYLFPD
jgi:hypothetical protein